MHFKITRTPQNFRTSIVQKTPVCPLEPHAWACRVHAPATLRSDVSRGFSRVLFTSICIYENTQQKEMQRREDDTCSRFTAFPRGTDVAAMHAAMSPTTAPLARHSVPTRVRSESTPHHERATKALPNSPSFPHSPSSVRLLTSSHIICSACRNRSPLTRHLGCWTLRLPPP